MDESKLKAKTDLETEAFAERYKEYIDQLENSPLAAARGGSITEFDIHALGKQLNQWETYHRICEETGSLNALGTLPTVAMSLITATQGVSIMPVIASVQPIEERQGLVWFNQVRASDTRGNATAGEQLEDPRVIGKTLSGYANSAVENEVGDTGDALATTFTFTLSNFPVLSQSLKIHMETGAVEGQDVGPASAATSGVGRIFGSGVSGTVTYATGVVALTFAVAPSSGNDIRADYQQNLEQATDLPAIEFQFDSLLVKAKPYVLKSTFGSLQEFEARKRFGKNTSEMIAQDLVAEINKEIGGDMIKQLVANAVGTTTFDRTPPANVSAFENRQEIRQALAQADATIAGNAGRGGLSILVAGRTMAATLSQMQGFQKIGDASAIGPHVYGSLDGITIVRVNEAAVLAAENGVALWKSPSPWEAAVVYAPYMPLMSSGDIPGYQNPLQKSKAYAVMSATKTVVPNFSTKFNFVTT